MLLEIHNESVIFELLRYTSPIQFDVNTLDMELTLMYTVNSSLCCLKFIMNLSYLNF
jgi:hypothetical protein